MKKLILSIALVMPLFSSITSCSSPPEKVGDVDLVAWRGDRAGCKNERQPFQQALEATKTELIGMSSNEIIKLFGKPDLRQLGERNQETYIYFLEEGPQCEKINEPSTANRVVFRFNAIKNLTDFNFQTIMPE